MILGSVEPTFRAVEPGAVPALADVDAFCRLLPADAQPMEYQRQLLADILATREDGTLAHRIASAVIPRQNGKSWLAVPLLLMGAFLEERRHQMYTAHVMTTAENNFRQLKQIVQASPALAKHTTRWLNGAGSWAMETDTGCRITWHSRTSTVRSQGRGLSPERVIIDEALNAKPAAIDALVPAVVARPNSQVVALSSAGKLESDWLRKLRDAGRDYRPGSLMSWHEWCRLPDDDADAEVAWARANPALNRGGGLSTEALRVARFAQSPEMFAHNHLGDWEETKTLEAALAGVAWDWYDDVGEPPPGVRPVMALDVSVDVVDKRTAALAVAWMVGDEVRVRIERVWTNVGGVQQEVAALWRELRSTHVHMCVGNAADVAARVEEERVPLVRGKRDDWNAIGPGLLEALAGGRVRAERSEWLERAAMSVPRTTGSDGRWWFSGRESIDPAAPLVAVALAVHQALRLGSGPVALSA